MANPMNTVSNIGVEPRRRTYLIDNSTITFSATAAGGSAQVGLMVTLSADNTVALVGDGEAVVGKLLSVEANLVCTVQIGGCMTAPAGTAATLTLGAPIMGDLLVAAKGYIQTSTTSIGRGFISNAATTTAVEIEL